MSQADELFARVINSADKAMKEAEKYFKAQKKDSFEYNYFQSVKKTYASEKAETIKCYEEIKLNEAYPEKLAYSLKAYLKITDLKYKYIVLNNASAYRLVAWINELFIRLRQECFNLFK